MKYTSTVYFSEGNASVKIQLDWKAFEHVGEL